MMTPKPLEHWHARARTVAARLVAMGIPARVEAVYEGPDCVELQFHPSPLATVALMEMLLAEIDRNTPQNGDRDLN